MTKSSGGQPKSGLNIPGFAQLQRLGKSLMLPIAVLPADASLPEIEGITVTASIGVAACIPGLEQRPDVLIARADRALYAAKAAGRNRVELALS